MPIAGDAAALFLQHLVAEPAIDEAVLLSTCNRVEIIAANAPEEAERVLRRAVASALTAPVPALEGMLVTRHGVEAVRHLCAVAAGLQSMVVAEGRAGQPGRRWSRRGAPGAAGPHLGAAFRAAVACGKRLHAETALGRTDFSVSSVLIDLLSNEITDWSAQQVLLIGAGRQPHHGQRLGALGAESSLPSPAARVPLRNGWRMMSVAGRWRTTRCRPWLVVPRSLFPPRVRPA